MHHLSFQDGVQAAERFIHQEIGWPCGERPGDSQSLSLSTGQLVWKTPRVVMQ